MCYSLGVIRVIYKAFFNRNEIRFFMKNLVKDHTSEWQMWGSVKFDLGFLIHPIDLIHLKRIYFWFILKVVQFGIQTA